MSYHMSQPWAFTSRDVSGMLECPQDIASCKNPADNCFLTSDGHDYAGTDSVTASGRTCQRWDSQSPHKHTRNDVNDFPGDARRTLVLCTYTERA